MELGRFGTVNPNYPKDFAKVFLPETQYDVDAGTKKKKWKGQTWDATTNTCKNVVAGLEVKVFHSRMGFTANLQRYILGAEIKPIITDWRHTGTGTATFSHKLGISFHEKLPSNFWY